MEPTPERRPSLITLIPPEPGEYPVDVERTAEDEVFGLLGFLSGLKKMWPNVEFVDSFGDRVEISTNEFLDLRDLNDLDRETFLRGRAHEILCGTDFKVSLIDPNKSQGLG